MRNFLAAPFGVYKGTLSGKPFNDRQGIKRTWVLANVQWSTYSVGLQPLGNANSVFNVTADLNAAGAQVVNQNWYPTSVYIDNQGVNFPVYVFFPDTQFAISCPPNSAGWYKVFSAARKAFIVGTGISDIDIANGAVTNVYFTDADMVPYLDQEFPTAVAQGIASPQINLGGNGGGLSSIAVLVTGTWYLQNQTNLALVIAGGGGSGASGHVTTDQYGRVTSATIDNPGTGYVSTPNITVSGGFHILPGWQPFVQYNVGDRVGESGNSWQCIVAVFNNVSPSLDGGAHWADLHVPAPSSAAAFSTTQTPITGGVSFSNEQNFGARALGDQPQSFIKTITAAGVLQDGLFSSPYASGFIYITNAHVVELGSGATDSFVMEAATGGTVFQFQSSSQAGSVLLNLQGCNIKLPASLDYRINVTGHGGGVNNSYAFNFAWSYSQN